MGKNILFWRPYAWALKPNLLLYRNRSDWGYIIRWTLSVPSLLIRVSFDRDKNKDLIFRRGTLFKTRHPLNCSNARATPDICCRNPIHAFRVAFVCLPSIPLFIVLRLLYINKQNDRTKLLEPKLKTLEKLFSVAVGVESQYHFKLISNFIKAGAAAGPFFGEGFRLCIKRESMKIANKIGFDALLKIASGGLAHEAHLRQTTNRTRWSRFAFFESG